MDALREAGEPGAAVLVSSVVARIGVANHEAIAAAKAGVEGLVRSAAATYAPSRIRVNAVASGIMDTPAVARIIGNDASRPGVGDGRRILQRPAAGEVGIGGQLETFQTRAQNLGGKRA